MLPCSRGTALRPQPLLATNFGSPSLARTLARCLDPELWPFPADPCQGRDKGQGERVPSPRRQTQGGCLVQVCAEGLVFPGAGRLPGRAPVRCKYTASQAQIAIFEQVTRNNSCTGKLKYCLKIILCLGSLKPGRSTIADIEFHFTGFFPAVMASLDPQIAFLHFKDLFSCKFLQF